MQGIQRLQESMGKSLPPAFIMKIDPHGNADNSTERREVEGI